MFVRRVKLQVKSWMGRRQVCRGQKSRCSRDGGKVWRPRRSINRQIRKRTIVGRGRIEVEGAEKLFYMLKNASVRLRREKNANNTNSIVEFWTVLFSTIPNRANAHFLRARRDFRRDQWPENVLTTRERKGRRVFPLGDACKRV